MRVLSYLPNTVVDGVGIRQVFYLAGCPHHCPQCHNPQSWDIDNGTEMSVDEIVTKALLSPYNVTFSGGDPLYQADQLKLVLSHLKGIKTAWVYTGYTWEEIMANETLCSVLPYIDVLVDGRFNPALKATNLRFRGSSNQRIIDVQKSLKEGCVVLWKDGNYD